MGIFFFSGQKVCFADFKHPCYKMAYFHELSSRVSFQEARLACESEGGVLLSLENEAEQKLIESMLQNLTKPGTGISDGDFWIGLWRNGDGQTSGACPDLYQWSDGSSSQYRWVWILSSWQAFGGTPRGRGRTLLPVEDLRVGQAESFSSHVSERSCYSLFAETGTRMNLPAEVKSVLWCITNQLPILALEVPTFTSGMMTGATWSTIIFASMNQVSSSKRRYRRFCACFIVLSFVFNFHYLWLFLFFCCEIENYLAASHITCVMKYIICCRANCPMSSKKRVNKNIWRDVFKKK